MLNNQTIGLIGTGLLTIAVYNVSMWFILFCYRYNYICSVSILVVTYITCTEYCLLFNDLSAGYIIHYCIGTGVGRPGGP